MGYVQHTTFISIFTYNTALYASEYGKGLKFVPVISYVWCLARNSYLPVRKIRKPSEYQVQTYTHIVNSCSENQQWLNLQRAVTSTFLDCMLSLWHMCEDTKCTVASKTNHFPCRKQKRLKIFSLYEQITRVGNLIVATIYLQLVQNRYRFQSFTVLQCSHQHCVQTIASDVEVVGYL